MQPKVIASKNKVVEPLQYIDMSDMQPYLNPTRSYITFGKPSPPHPPTHPPTHPSTLPFG